MKSLSFLLLMQWLAVVVVSRSLQTQRLPPSAMKEIFRKVVPDDGGGSLVTERISKQLNGQTGHLIKHFLGKLISPTEEHPATKKTHAGKPQLTTHSKKESVSTASDKNTGSISKKKSSVSSEHDSSENKFDQTVHSLRTMASDLIQGIRHGDTTRVSKLIENARTQKRKGASVAEAIEEMANGEPHTDKAAKHATKIKTNSSRSSNETLQEDITSLIGDIVPRNKSKSPLFHKLIKGLTPKTNETDAVLDKMNQFQENKTLEQIVNSLQAKSKQMEFMSKLWMDKGIPLGYGDTVFTNSRALAQLMTKRSEEELNNLPKSENGVVDTKRLLQMAQKGHLSLQNLLSGGR